jgi:hypothetical protein
MVQPDDLESIYRLGAAMLCEAGEIKLAAIATGMALAVLVADSVLDPVIAKRRGRHRRMRNDALRALRG